MGGRKEGRMELAKCSASGLQLLGNATLVGEGSFERLLSAAFHNLLHDDDDDAHRPVEGESAANVGFLKQAYGALVVFVVEAAKKDADATSLSSVLEECQMEPPRATTVIERFMKHKCALRDRLKSYGTSFPHIVDVDWTLDYCVKSDVMDKFNEPVYYVSLKTEKSGQSEGLEDVRFACTLEQMQDLVSKLKEATKCVQRASQT